MELHPPRFWRAAALIAAALFAFTLLMEDNMAQADQKTPTPADYAAVEQAINNVIGWAIDKDFDRFFATLADDSKFISVTPYARVKFGIDEVKADTGFWASPDFKAVGHELHDLRIHFSESGEVAWFYCVLDDWNEWKGQPANWLNCRWTGVLEKRAGVWRLVQQHYSWAKER